jgi:hypothetical protein
VASQVATQRSVGLGKEEQGWAKAESIKEGCWRAGVECPESIKGGKEEQCAPSAVVQSYGAAALYAVATIARPRCDACSAHCEVRACGAERVAAQSSQSGWSNREK